MCRPLFLLLCAVFICGKMAAGPVEDVMERIAGGASQHFLFVVDEGKDDYFELSQEGDKICITGNTLSSLGVGLNWYLKYYCGVHLTIDNMSSVLPMPLPPVLTPERHTCSLPLRYAFNYCTFSYTMAFWDWQQWQRALDWLFLHGVNLPLSAVGMECVWREVLRRQGFDDAAIGQFIAGPAFLAWWAMGNLEGWGGPLPDEWYARQEQLQRQILARERELGMSPILPGYYGMLPRAAVSATDGEEERWNGYRRPVLLDPCAADFAATAALFYSVEDSLFGPADYYSMDPFHELTTPDMDLSAAACSIYSSLQKAHEGATWVVQGWDANPRPEVLAALDTGSILILDLFSECRPMFGIPSLWQRADGYGDHNWLFCMLENFGANVGLHGRLDQLLANYSAATDARQHYSQHLQGLGLTMEGLGNNPVMFELFCELPWRELVPTKEEWLSAYVPARYGTADTSLSRAWQILGNSIYNCPRGNNQQGSTESIFCARPSLAAYQVSSWSKMEDYYSADSTLAAAQLFLAASDRLRGNDNYAADLVDVVRQAVSDHAREVYKGLVAAYDGRDRAAYDSLSSRFLHLLLLQDTLLSTRAAFSVDTWIAQARAAGLSSAAKDLYEWNAKVQVTTWGNRYCAEEGGLRDYAHKEWSGMLRDVYYPRWAAFFALLAAHWDDDGPLPAIDYYAMDEAWTISPAPPSPSSSSPSPPSSPDVVAVARRVVATITDYSRPLLP